MKKLIYFFVLPILLLSTATIDAQTTRAKKIQGSIMNGILTLNKIQLNPTWNLQNAKKVLGQPQRQNDGVNRVHMFDSLGVVVYEKKKSNQPIGIISEIDIYFSIKESGYLTPSNLYNGTLTVEGINITKDTKMEEIEKVLTGKGYKKTTTKMFVKNGTYVIFTYEGNQLENVSVGKA